MEEQHQSKINEKTDQPYIGYMTWERYEREQEYPRETCFRCNTDLEDYDVFVDEYGEGYCSESCYDASVYEFAAPKLYDACKLVHNSLNVGGKQSRAFASEIKTLEDAIQQVEIPLSKKSNSEKHG